MERYLWTIDDKKLFESEPVRLRYGERVRITYRNETMMEHPMHMHGMFVGLQTGQGAFAPRKHTVIVNPSETLSVDFTANERGPWALHCHLLLHMVAGMFAKIVVGDEVGAAAARASR
jgi:FtsP/CotA-like multicopper oxidase with cupredoxin domain